MRPIALRRFWRCDGSISIPMAGRSESLNAGVAASLIAFEALWQRERQHPVATT